MAVQIVTLKGKKYQLIPIEKGTKPPSGVETFQWTDGKDYILSPVESKAPAKEQPKTPVKEEPKAPAKEESKDRAGSNAGFWVAIVILLCLVVFLLVSKFTASVRDAQNPNTSAPVSAPTTNVISESTILDLGSVGAYHAVYDANVQKWTLGIWEEAATRQGDGLADFKARASSVSFVMPADGTINNSAGHISVNGVEWNLGNPAVDQSGNTTVPQGAQVTIWSDGPNESFGFQIWFNQ